MRTNLAPPDQCLCSGDPLDGPDPSVHWDSPTGSRVVATSCSAEHGDRIEALRNSEGVMLTVILSRARREYRNGEGPL